jgi:hypothetical protein
MGVFPRRNAAKAHRLAPTSTLTIADYGHFEVSHGTCGFDGVVEFQAERYSHYPSTIETDLQEPA